MGDWSIVYVQKPLGVAVHGIIEVLDDAGQVVFSMEGLAKEADGKRKPIGTSAGDTIEFVHGLGVSPNSDKTTFAPQQVFSGSRQDVVRLVERARAAGNLINLKNIGYPPIGVFPSDQSMGVSNSNAVISTLFKAMGLEEPFPDMPAPGRGNILLSPSEINSVQKNAAPWPGAPGSTSQSRNIGPPLREAVPLPRARPPFAST